MPDQENILNVMVSEDDPDDQYLFESAFKELGYPVQVQFVLTGDQLIQQLLRNMITRQGRRHILPDLIIADLKKPFFWFDALKELRIYSQFRDIPVYLFSMRADDQVRQMASQQGATAIFEKPHTYHDLRRIIREIARSLTGVS